MSVDKNFLAAILKNLCAEMGAGLELEREYGRAGCISFANGRRGFFKGACFDINGMGAAQIAKDKDYCAKFLRSAGINTPSGKLVYSPRAIKKLTLKNPRLGRGLVPYSEAPAAAADFGFPLFVKPNEGAEGEGVQMVASNDELLTHLSLLYQAHDLVLLQKPVPGEDHRVIVLDGEVFAAYRRTALGVTGNGTDTVAGLLAKRTDELAARGRPSDVSPDDPRISQHLRSQGLGLRDVIENGRQVQLLVNANLSSGGGVSDVTDDIAGEYKRICADAAGAVGLRFAGVDILCRRIDRYDEQYGVLEVNGAPGLSHYAAAGEHEKQNVIGLYRALLTKMSLGDPK
ncbi:MAG: hypothetical protein QF521_23840 [Alphaproteobacteria bacterium]|nr:hypothetical protein [Alphaproteobacteria bacterium]